MIGLRTKHQGLLAVIFALVVTIGVPTLVNAQGRGHGRGWDKKAERFRNGHDARDGRWDGRGRRRDRDDDFFDDDDRRNRRWRRDRNRNDDFRFVRRNRRVVNRFRVNNGNGYSAGFNAGLNDRANGERFGYWDEYGFRNANGIFRESFRRGYEEGYRSGRSRGGFFGGVLGRRWR